MKKAITLAAILSISIATAQKWNNEKIKENKNQTTISRTTESYDKITTEGSLHIELVSGKEGNIIIEGDENIAKHIVTEVKGNELKVYFEKNKNYSYKNEIKITIPFEEISKISFAGSGSMITKNEINTLNFETKIAGSGDCKLKINAKNITAKMAGSGNLTLSGKTEEFEAKIAGSGDLDATKLTTQNANVTVAGSGSLKVDCTNNLIAKVAGSGSIQYKEKPQTIDKNITGSGNISSY